MEKAGDGGNIRLINSTPGDVKLTLGAPGTRKGALDGAPGNFIFELADGSEAMCISGTGLVTIRGEVVDDNTAVYLAFASWLGVANLVLNEGEGDGENAHAEYE